MKGNFLGGPVLVGMVQSLLGDADAMRLRCIERDESADSARSRWTIEAPVGVAVGGAESPETGSVDAAAPPVVGEGLGLLLFSAVAFSFIKIKPSTKV
jgi:hypothetical protein